MNVEIYLNPEHPEAGALQADLAGELNAIQSTGITITSMTSPPPPGTLGAAEVYQFLVDYHNEVVASAALLSALLNVISAVLRRRDISPHAKPQPPRTKGKKPTKPKAKQSKQPPVVIIVAGDARLEIPCTPSRESAFIARLTAPVAAPDRLPKKSKSK